MRFDVGDVVKVVDAWDPNVVKEYSDRDKYLGAAITIRKVYPDIRCYAFMEDEHEPMMIILRVQDILSAKARLSDLRKSAI